MIESFCRRDYAELKESPGTVYFISFTSPSASPLLADPGILVCHRLRRKHPSGARLAMQPFLPPTIKDYQS
jgi:hypothetical protein